MSDPQLDLEAEALEQARARVREAMREALEILRADVSVYAEKEVKERFLANASFASGLPNAALKALKSELGVAVSAQEAVLDAAFGQEATWRAASAVAAAERAGFEQVSSIWGAASAIDDALRALLARHGFPDHGDPHYGLHYKAPARFIGGKHLKATSERFWRALADVERLESEKQARVEKQSREELLRRWEDA
jgi:hypothetical protein